MRDGNRGRLLACGLALAAWSCAGTEAPSYGGESHWLDGCVYDGDCGGGSLRCVCGTCTRGCASDDGCGERGDALCVNAGSPLLQRRCERQSLPAHDGVCIARCEGDDSCLPGKACVSGACVPLMSMPDAAVGVAPDAAVPTPDGGVTAPPDASDPIRDRIDDLATVDASVSFDVPVQVPKVDDAILGGDERLIGTWKQVDCDPSKALCARFEIQRNAGGAIGGTLIFEPMPTVVQWVMTTPVDPERGFPPGVTSMEYDRLRQMPASDVPYRMLDGRFEGTRLRFFWSPLDLWQGWCALQTPHRWQEGARDVYQCVPQDPEELANIDPYKVVLCRHQNIPTGVPSCDEPSRLCLCDPGFVQGCPYPFCRCDAQACQADVHLYQIPVDLSLTGGRLVGDFRDQAGQLNDGVEAFERVSP